MCVKSNLNKKSVYTPLCNYTQVLRSIHNSQPFNYNQVFVKSLWEERRTAVIISLQSKWYFLHSSTYHSQTNEQL